MSGIPNRQRSARRVLRRRHPDTYVPPTGEDGYPTSTVRVSTLTITNGAAWTVPADAHYLYDLGTGSSVVFGHVTINGKLSFDSAASQKMVAASITNNGKFAATPDDSRWPGSRTLTVEVNGAEEGKVEAYMVDQTATSGAGNGVLKRLWQSTSAAPTANETITITFTSSTAFTVSGTVSGSNFATGAVGVLFNNKVRFIATAGTVAWAPGHTRTLRVERKGWLNDSRSRGIRNMAGAQMVFKGATKTAFTRLQGTAAAPSVTGSVMPLADVVSGWNSADRVIVTTTDYYQWGASTSNLANNEAFTISALDAPGKSLTLSASLARPRWAMQQWVKEDGVDANGRLLGSLSLTDPGYTPHVAGVPKMLDERAFVANLERNIVFQGANDSAWADTTNGRLGLHVMNMGLASTFILEYVAVKRAGQRGRHGRYAIHNHMPSYNLPDGGGFPSDGTYLGDCDPAKQYLLGCVVDGSAQHGVQNHGACGWKVTDTVVHDCDGHAFNLEDGSELRYTFERCGASHVRSIPQSSVLQTKAHEGRSAGFWLTNSGGTMADCWAVRCDRGEWKSNALRCFGLSRDVAEYPSYRRPGRLENLHIMCTQYHSAVNGGDITDERGAVQGYMEGFHVQGQMYDPRTNDLPGGPIFRPTLLKGYQFFKPGDTGDAYTNRVALPEYTELTAADCPRTILTGTVQAGRLTKALLVGKSLNHTTFKGTLGEVYERAGSASYHNTQVNQDCLYLNFPPGRPAVGTDPYYHFDIKGGKSELTACVNQSSDYYENPLEVGFMHHTGCKFLSAEPALRSRMWNHRQLATGEPDNSYSNSALSPADLDAHGWWGPANWWRVPNLPYYTTGLSASQPVIMGFGADATTDPYWVCTPDKQYVLMEATMDTDMPQPPQARSAVDGAGDMDVRVSELTLQQLDASFNPISGAAFTLKKGNAAANLHYKRFLGIRKNTRVRLSLGDTPTPALYAQYWVYGAGDSDDSFVIAIPWAADTVKVAIYSGSRYAYPGVPSGGMADARAYTSVASRALLDASAGSTYWLDTANDLVWIKWQGGIARPSTDAPTDRLLWSQFPVTKPITLYINP